jgi:hypothetical protein
MLLIIPLIFNVHLRPRRDLPGSVLIDSAEGKPITNIPDQGKGYKAKSRVQRNKVRRAVL